MARITPRLMWDDHTKLGATVLSGAIAEAGFPVERVLDARRSKTFRTKAGWNIIADENDRIDFREGVAGDATAQLVAGNYATGALMAAQVETAINIAATDNTWTCTYDPLTQKFTIGHDNVEIGGLKWETGNNAFRSAARSLGYFPLDDTGASSYPADSPTRHSADAIVFDFGAVPPPIQCAAVITSGNASVSMNLQASTVSNFTTTPVDVFMEITGRDPADPGKMVHYFSTEQVYQYWRFISIDLVPDASFFEFGAVFLGPFSTFLRAYDLNTAQPRQELSDIEEGDFGAIFTDVKPSRRRWQYGFRELPDVDHDEWELIANSKRVGGHVWYGADPQNSPVVKTRYGFIDDPGIGFEHIRSDVSAASLPEGSWNVTFPFAEAVS